MELRGQYVGEVMERERRLVREHTGLLRPEPGHDEILMLADWEVNEAIDASSHSHDPPIAEVLVKQRRRIACGGCLSSREVATLGLSNGIESPPIWSAFAR